MIFKVLNNESFVPLDLDITTPDWATSKRGHSKKHYFYDFSPHKKFDQSIVASMHQWENYNNVEVLKLGLWCKKHNIKLTMYGFFNQLPLFGIFADAVILQDAESWSNALYNATEEEGFGSCYITDQVSFEKIRYYQKMFSNGVFDLSRDIVFNEQHPLLRDHFIENDFKTWPLLLSLSEKEISDEEVVEAYANPVIHIRRSAKEKYDQMVCEGFIKPDILMCEVKTGYYCGGEHLLSCFKKATEGYPIEICMDIDFKKLLASRCGQDYMAVQMLCSAFSNWMWACYGGSSNIFPFFPIKLASVSDAYCRYALIRKLFRARLGELGEIFPETNTLVYCLPGEKDGPSRTDGQPPLPNLQKMVMELSNMKIKSYYLSDKKIL